MSIEYYGSEPSINIESAAELYEALDILHTQVIDNLNEDKTLLTILSDAMDQVEKARQCVGCGGQGTFRTDNFETACSKCGGTGLNPGM